MTTSITRPVYEDPDSTLQEPDRNACHDLDAEAHGEDAVGWSVGFDARVTFSWEFEPDDGESPGLGVFISLSDRAAASGCSSRRLTPDQLAKFGADLVVLANRARMRQSGHLAATCLPVATGGAA